MLGISIIDADPSHPVDESNLDWSDEEEYIKVDNLLDLVSDNHRFCNVMFQGGATRVGVERMREEKAKDKGNKKKKEKTRISPVTSSPSVDASLLDEALVREEHMKMFLSKMDTWVESALVHIPGQIERKICSYLMQKQPSEEDPVSRSHTPQVLPVTDQTDDIAGNGIALVISELSPDNDATPNPTLDPQAVSTGLFPVQTSCVSNRSKVMLPNLNVVPPDTSTTEQASTQEERSENDAGGCDEGPSQVREGDVADPSQCRKCKRQKTVPPSLVDTDIQSRESEAQMVVSGKGDAGKYTTLNLFPN